ncbi:hypothetical protein [Edaphobacillus lindanitolerans]|uniref:Uncharacterized protein n=1 Tax=Edaphobacillus lindanitolerans TaxID=550447 RepID=A0A1U7PRK8_9BACI|nr:hypothetical protein [Edaphobacillus lindanitolerans]SIT87469.1 hypothetical protein SAMN05428946_2102 [Edaphobacillus lindanitolerans]
MTYYHYLAADRKLPETVLGEKVRYMKFSELPLPDDPGDIRNLLDPKDLEAMAEEMVPVYDTELDAVFVTVTPVDGDEADGLPVTKPFIHQIDGIFEGDPEAVQKCAKELLGFLRSEFLPGEEVELYTCLSGEEDEARNEGLDRKINLQDPDLRVPLWFRDRQLVTLKR